MHYQRAIISLTGWLIFLLINTSTAWAESSRLELIQQRGKLIVGVKADYQPWGMMNASGRLIGIEPDLARNLAHQLGVKLQLVAVTSSNRLQKVESGAVDLLLATLSDTPARRQLSGLLEPNYYSSGVNILLPRQSAITSWDSLRGRQICLSNGAFFNRTLIQRHLINPVIFKGTRDTLLALEAGRCEGWVYDDVALQRLKQDDPRWQNYYLPLSPIMVQPWAAAVSRAERNSSWGLLVSDIMIDWHRNGELSNIVAAWGLSTDGYLLQQQQLWNQALTRGGYLCSRQADGTLPLACIDRKLALATNHTDLQARFGVMLRNLGLDFPPLYDEFSLSSLLEGLALTLGISLTAMLGGLVFGTLIGTLHGRGNRPTRIVLNMINATLRMTPPILSLYLIFFGIGSWAALQLGVTFNALIIACIVFSLYAGASNAVIFSVALQTVTQTQPDASLRQLLPETLDRAWSGLMANSVNIVKAVGIASTIAVPEIISAANSIISEHGTTSVIMNFLVLFYFGLITLMLWLLKHTKGWVRRWAHKSN